MLIPDDKIAEIRARCDIVKIIGEYVPLRRAGGPNHKGLCPFHGEKSPSFNVNSQRGMYYCFGCHESGDAMRFLMKLQGRSFVEVATELARQTGVELPQRSSLTPEQERQARSREDERARLLRVNEISCDHFRGLLAGPEGAPARDYLDQRGVEPRMVEEFRLGYAADSWDDLVTHLAAQQIASNLPEKLGLIVPRQSDASGRGHYDRFRHRLIFPVQGLGGEVVAFGGRVLPRAAAAPATPGNEPPKYLNSPESLIYRKGAVLYGLSQARTEIRRRGVALLVEGNLDVVMLHQAGLKHAVAPMGTAFTAEQAQLLRRFSERVVLCLDGDEAGRSKTLDCALTLLEARFDVRIVTPPDGEDPDSWVRRAGTEAVEQALEAAVPAADHFIDVHTRGDTSIPGRARALERLAPVLALVHNRTERDLYALRLSEILGVSQDDVLKKIRMVQPRAEAGAATSGARITAPGRAEPVRPEPASGAAAQAPAAAAGTAASTAGSTGSRPLIDGTLDPFEIAILQILATHSDLCALAEVQQLELGGDLARTAHRALIEAGGDSRLTLEALQSAGQVAPGAQSRIAQAFLGTDFEGHTEPLHALRGAVARMAALRIKDELSRLDAELRRARALGDEAGLRTLALRKRDKQLERAALLAQDRSDNDQGPARRREERESPRSGPDDDSQMREARPPPDPRG